MTTEQIQTGIEAMSLEKKDLRLKLAPDMMERLRVCAATAGMPGTEMNAHAQFLLEKAIMGEFHMTMLRLKRTHSSEINWELLGMTGNIGEYQSEDGSV